jgi:hypothetical protein
MVLNDELGNIWKGQIHLMGLRKNTENFSHDNQLCSWYLNCAFPEYKSDICLLHQSVSVNKTFSSAPFQNTVHPYVTVIHITKSMPLQIL